jgi:hypothetical protein
LGFAIDALDHPVKVTEQRERQGGQPTRVGTAGFLEKASYTAALVAYMGCFGTGKRRPSRPGASSPAAWRIFWSATGHHKDTRNKHIAHSPNASDVTSSAAWIRGVCSDEPGTRRVGAIHAFGSSDATPGIHHDEYPSNATTCSDDYHA